jgi:hypothetical protein
MSSVSHSPAPYFDHTLTVPSVRQQDPILCPSYSPRLQVTISFPPGCTSTPLTPRACTGVEVPVPSSTLQVHNRPSSSPAATADSARLNAHRGRDVSETLCPEKVCSTCVRQRASVLRVHVRHNPKGLQRYHACALHSSPCRSTGQRAGSCRRATRRASSPAEIWPRV